MHAFLARALYDLAAAQSAALVVLGDRLGLYRAMRGAGSLTPGELAARTGLDERYVREWLFNQACGGYLSHVPEAGTFELPEEQARALAEEGGRVFLAGSFQTALAALKSMDAVEEAFRSGGGIPSSAYDPDLAEGMARTSRARYQAELLQRYIPALDGMKERLEVGASVADVGCGSGAALLLLARAFPHSRFVGFDASERALEMARAAARAAGLGEGLRFERAPATDFPGEGYDLVTSFESLHDVGDPLGVARRVLRALGPDGRWLIVEPLVGEGVDVDTPWGRLASSMSVLHCLPVSIADGGPGLGPLAGERGVTEVLAAAGFGSWSRVAASAFQLVIQARP
ncbi:MAG TPA: class I SAM-dependent methyltransferase [Vicinamibacteria bacterium]|nr:class I SAM-dependent methyltransferase [Vicinamibacteria bacterium]